MSDRIIKSKENYKNFDKYVQGIGLPALAYYTQQNIHNIINEPDPHLNPFHVFQQIPNKKWIFEYNIVPYGAASSYLGAIQSFARGLVTANDIDPTKKKANIWDYTAPGDGYGLDFTTLAGGANHIEDTFKWEAVILDLYQRRNSVTWTQLWRTYVSWLGRKFIPEFDESLMKYRGLPLDNKVTNVATFHIDPITIPFFCESHNKFFLDMEFERFVWCHLLSYVKHSLTGEPGARNIAMMLNQGFDAEKSRPFIDRCNIEWVSYSRCKKFGPKPILSLTYQQLLVEQDVSAIKVFLEASVGSDMSDETVSEVQRLLKVYNEENNKLMAPWNDMKDEILGLPWDRTYG